MTANNGLTYDATADQYNYVWKTQSTYANKCFKFDMVLKDGSPPRGVLQVPQVAKEVKHTTPTRGSGHNSPGPLCV